MSALHDRADIKRQGTKAGQLGNESTYEPQPLNALSIRRINDMD